MSFRVRVMPRARRQLYESALWWAEHRSTEQAALWLERFEAELESLTIDLQRWPVALESDAAGVEIREMAFGLGKKKTHRAVFRIHDQSVVVYAVRHLAQDQLAADDF